MGTPEFAVPSLEGLVNSRHTVAGVVTVPDKPSGRGLKRRPSAVKQAAADLGLPVLQPAKLKDPDFLAALRKWQADCYAVVAFRILPAEVFGIPKYGTVNLHASLLPKYRGAAPIQWVLMHGEHTTGVTTFLIDRKVDTGDILMQKRVPIGPEEHAESLHDKLADQGADLLVRTMDLLEQGELEPQPQRGEASPAPKIRPEHCRINWSRDCDNIRNQIRALSPFPGAFTGRKGRRIKIFKAACSPSPAAVTRDPGTILSTAGDRILVQCGSGQLEILDLQLEGRKRMEASHFLRGNPLQPGERFSDA